MVLVLLFSRLQAKPPAFLSKLLGFELLFVLFIFGRGLKGQPAFLKTFRFRVVLILLFRLQQKQAPFLFGCQAIPIVELRHLAMGQNPVPPSGYIPIPTRIGSKMGGEFTHQPKWHPKTLLTHSQISMASRSCETDHVTTMTGKSKMASQNGFDPHPFGS